MQIGSTIKELRKQKGYSQIEFGKLCNMNQSSLSLIENNERVPNKRTLERISKVLDVPIVIIYFMSIDKSMVPKERINQFDNLYPIAKHIVNQIFK